MSLRTFLLVVLQLPALISFAQTDTYAARRDSVLHAPKMQAVLKHDSLLCNTEYFARKNQVRVMIETEGEHVDSSFYTIWGGLERRVSYTENELWFVDTYEYNEFGDLSKAVYRVYDEGFIQTISTYTYSYRVLPDGLSERLIRKDHIHTRVRGPLKDVSDTNSTVYEYDRNNRLTASIRTGKHWTCVDAEEMYTETITYEYDKQGDNCRRISETKGSCQPPVKEIAEMSYNTSHQLIGRVVMNGSDTVSFTEWVRGVNGRPNHYNHKEYALKNIYSSDSYYSDNGLESHETAVHNGEQTVHRYSYIYYTGNGTSDKEKRKK